MMARHATPVAASGAIAPQTIYEKGLSHA